jgi:hypothetical protein
MTFSGIWKGQKVGIINIGLVMLTIIIGICKNGQVNANLGKYFS